MSAARKLAEIPAPVPIEPPKAVPPVPVPLPVPIPAPEPIAPLPAGAADVVLDDVVEVFVAALADRDKAIEAMAVLIAEQKAQIAAVNERLDRLFAPEQPADGLVALRRAAEMIGRSDEYLRSRAARGEIAAEIIGGKWFVNASALAALALPNGIADGTNRP
jgi:hypothetical protein